MPSFRGTVTEQNLKDARPAIARRTAALRSNLI